MFRRYSRAVERALALAVMGWVAVHTIRVMHAGWPYTQDDMYVTLRYSRNLFEGHGLVWNIGETTPVEGYSNFLFVLLGAASLKLGIDPVFLLKLLGCVVVAPTCALLYILARRWLSPLLATLPAVFLTLHTGLTFWAVSGMETTVFQLFVVAATTTFVLGMDAPMRADAIPGRLARFRTRVALHRASAVLCLLAAMTRPEGPILVVVLALTALLDAGVTWLRGRRAGDRDTQDGARRAFLVSLRAFVVAFLVPCVLYYVWRIAHFGRLLPNTVYCKAYYSDKGGDPWYLVEDFWKGAKVYVALAFLQDPRKLGAKALPLFLLPLVYAGILHHADPIVGQFARHFLAALALLVVASAMGVANAVAWVSFPIRCVIQRVSKRPVPASSLPTDAIAVAACLALYARGQAWLENDTPRECAHRFDDAKEEWLLTPPFDLTYHASCYESRENGRAALGRYMDSTLSPGSTFVLGDVGVVGYLAHANIIDAFCLNSPELTRPPISFDRGRFIDSIFERAPDEIIVHSWTPAPRVQALSDEAGFYAALVSDPRFRQHYELKAGAPSFHAAIRAEGYYYVVYARKTP